MEFEISDSSGERSSKIVFFTLFCGFLGYS
jgi:hypothetical protein